MNRNPSMILKTKYMGESKHVLQYFTFHFGNTLPLDGKLQKQTFNVSVKISLFLHSISRFFKLQHWWNNEIQKSAFCILSSIITLSESFSWAQFWTTSFTSERMMPLTNVWFYVSAHGQALCFCSRYAWCFLDLWMGFYYGWIHNCWKKKSYRIVSYCTPTHRCTYTPLL